MASSSISLTASLPYDGGSSGCSCTCTVAPSRLSARTLVPGRNMHETRAGKGKGRRRGTILLFPCVGDGRLEGNLIRGVLAGLAVENT